MSSNARRSRRGKVFQTLPAGAEQRNSVPAVLGFGDFRTKVGGEGSLGRRLRYAAGLGVYGPPPKAYFVAYRDM